MVACDELKICLKCGGTYLYWEYDDKLGKDIRACLCGWRDYEPEKLKYAKVR